MKRKLLLSTLLLLLAVQVGWGQVPQTISYQGVLTDANGNVVSDGNYNLSFKLYDAATGGTPLWFDGLSVSVKDGIFNVILGSQKALTIPFDKPYWLGVTVGSGTELTPRIELTSSAYSLHARSASGGGGGDGHSLDAADGSPVDALFVDNDGNVGIGTGNVGIGTTDPKQRLHIKGGAGIPVPPSPTIMLEAPFAPSGEQALGLIVAGNSGDFGISRFTDGGDKLLRTDLMVNASTGNIGIGTTTPGSRLHISSTTGTGVVLQNPNFASGGQAAGMLLSALERSLLFGRMNDAGNTMTRADLMIQATTGNVGIGTTSPGGALHVVGAGIITERNGGPFIRFLDSSGAIGNKTWVLQSNAPLGGFRIRNETDNADRLVIDANGNVRVNVLEIAGGSDLSEQFDVAANNSDGTDSSPDQIQPGMVVSIDAENSGKLVVSSRAYDRRVAGIISGAGGVKPGMLMSQAGTLAGGQYPVALTGRVYCLADAANGPIQIGDLLTTSETAGHAMKVTDYTHAHGAIIGKAMTKLEQGQGLVLVLVALQ